ncbi:uncharacterized protein LOC118434558 [Folsomia candida]|uniref:uncharacterized protein LOC118434558 n=1 Tax=Folsomia candida TaxID=158441 RepID=UPI001604C3B0|nr:uncharacterized protein LOC118434558 [Folsomia candida]
MTIATISVIGFCIIMFALVVYFCFWAHRKTTILSAASFNGSPTYIIRQRYACRHHRNCGSRHEQTAATTVYTIPVVRSSPLENSPSIVQPPPQYGQHRCSRPRPEFLNIARQNRDPPPKYEEVMMSRPLSVTPIPT